MSGSHHHQTSRFRGPPSKVTYKKFLDWDVLQNGADVTKRSHSMPNLVREVAIRIPRVSRERGTAEQQPSDETKDAQLVARIGRASAKEYVRYTLAAGQLMHELGQETPRLDLSCVVVI